MRLTRTGEHPWLGFWPTLSLVMLPKTKALKKCPSVEAFDETDHPSPIEENPIIISMENQCKVNTNHNVMLHQDHADALPPTMI
jgi:hypothetical protein